MLRIAFKSTMLNVRVLSCFIWKVCLLRDLDSLGTNRHECWKKICLSGIFSKILAAWDKLYKGIYIWVKWKLNVNLASANHGGVVNKSLITSLQRIIRLCLLNEEKGITGYVVDFSIHHVELKRRQESLFYSIITWKTANALLWNLIIHVRRASSRFKTMSRASSKGYNNNESAFSKQFHYIRQSCFYQFKNNNESGILKEYSLIWDRKLSVPCW